MYQVSGKNWKAPAPRMSATGTAKLKTSWDKKMAAKAEAALFREQKQEARADHNAKLTVSCGLPVLCWLILGLGTFKAPAGAQPDIADASCLRIRQGCRASRGGAVFEGLGAAHLCVA